MTARREKVHLLAIGAAAMILIIDAFGWHSWWHWVSWTIVVAALVDGFVLPWLQWRHSPEGLANRAKVRAIMEEIRASDREDGAR